MEFVWNITQLPGAGMSTVVNFGYVLNGKLRVLLRGRKPFMPQQFLDGAQISAFSEHVCAKGMPERVRMNIWRQPFGHCNLLDDAAYAACGKRASATIDQ
jgi:hypothetical protein